MSDPTTVSDRTITDYWESELEELDLVLANGGGCDSGGTAGRAEFLRTTLAARQRDAAALEKAERFKQWTHAYLDAKGVPHHPPGTHGATGCRIGDRMDWVWAERDALAAELARLRAALAAVKAEFGWVEGVKAACDGALGK